mgnify:CR=1 FL=1
MNEIAVHSQQQLDLPADHEPATVQLAKWAVAADAAHRIATRLVGTAFAPAAYRGKPDEATAAILAGAEIGLSPTASLRAFDIIQGIPAPKAITLRAIVQGRGHEVKVVESGPEKAVVAGRRAGDTDWQTSTWTLDRARAMGLLGKEQWKRQPAAMLVARATAEVCRWIASDAIMGMPYTVEEIRDEGPVVEARPRPRVTAAEIRRPAAPLPGESETDQPATGQHSPAPISADQRRHIATLLDTLGVTDQATELAGYARVTGRQITSITDLTASEADQVIESLQAHIDQRERAA